MEPDTPEFLPTGPLDHDEMKAMQRDIADLAQFNDSPPLAIEDCVVAGVDQAFTDDAAISAIVVQHNGDTLERVAAVTDLDIPYIPGLLAFREGPPIADAFRKLETTPDLVLFDGSGRLHYRQAGLATHLGVVFDRPSFGVAKSLLCGEPTDDIDHLSAGEQVPIEATTDVEAPPGTVLGYAVQTRQYTTSARHINPLYVSPGHRVSTETAAAATSALSTDYKLPDPIRAADEYAGAISRDPDSANS